MARTVGIGYQDFARLRMEHNFYVDKTYFIREWWENQDAVTLITRPRRFGKTLNMSMVEQFFSVNYSNRSDLFEGLAVWENEELRGLQGAYPVISLSFANIKETSYKNTRDKLVQLLAAEYARHSFLLEGDLLSPEEKEIFRRKKLGMEDVDLTLSVNQLSEYLCRYYGKKVILLLDEYDTPMQEAYIHGFWKDMVGLTRSFFNASFKTNPWMERAILTGITRISRESVFSDLNHLVVVTATSRMYSDCFGFTEKEVLEALKEYGLDAKMQQVKNWYDGFVFGETEDIYNPWSIINYLKTETFAPYWANTSSNSLAGRLLQQSSKDMKLSFENLLNGGSLITELDEQIVFEQLEYSESAIWSLLLASGYLKVRAFRTDQREQSCWRQKYELELTNFEVKVMFQSIITGWFEGSRSDYHDFQKAMFQGDEDAMNEYMNRISLSVFSYFDTGSGTGRKAEPERFYHGFVLGLIVDLEDRYIITSNRESGFGRYDVMLKPRRAGDAAVIMEFKVHNPRREKNLEETAQNALRQIEEKNYLQELQNQVCVKGPVYQYGFAFEGKHVLIRMNEN